ncbi:MAG TPA: response regulator [Thermoanaerobaculia bacterium]|nr:response regulator [Thermoanaerobaculia bacterium]
MTKRILIVDNEESILAAVKRYFTRRGYTVDCARELEEAEALATYIEYDVAILDLSLRDHCGREGLEILRFVRQSRPHTRTILLTAHGTPMLEREAFRRGCDVFLHKPKPLGELAKIAEELTEKCA